MHYAALLCDLKPAQPIYVCPHLNLHLIYRPQMHCRAVFSQRIKKCELRAVQCRVNCVQNAIITTLLAAHVVNEGVVGQAPALPAN